MTSIFLSSEELEVLTGRKRPKAQADILRNMGIQYKLNAVGLVIVGRKHVEQVLGADGCRTHEAKEPKFNLLEKGRAA